MSAARTRSSARRLGRFSDRRRVLLRDVPHGAQFAWGGRRWIMVRRGEERIAAVYCQRGTCSKGMPKPTTRVTIAKGR